MPLDGIAHRVRRPCSTIQGRMARMFSCSDRSWWRWHGSASLWASYTMSVPPPLIHEDREKGRFGPLSRWVGQEYAVSKQPPEAAGSTCD